MCEGDVQWTGEGWTLVVNRQALVGGRYRLTTIDFLTTDAPCHLLTPGNHFQLMGGRHVIDHGLVCASRPREIRTDLFARVLVS